MNGEEIKKGPDLNTLDSGIEVNTTSKLVEYLNHNGFPHVENIDLTVVRGPHSKHDDPRLAGKFFKGADVAVLEMSDWNPLDVEWLQRVADGREAPETHGPFVYGLARELRGGSTRVAVADLPEGSSELEEYLKVLRSHKISHIPRLHKGRIDLVPTWLRALNTRLKGLGIGVSRKEARNIVREQISELVGADEKREQYIADHLGPALIKAMKGDRKMPLKKTLVVKVFMGTYHTRLQEKITAMHPSTKGRITAPRLLFSYGLEAGRRIAYGLQVPDDLIDDVLMEDIIVTASTRNLPKNLGELKVYLRTLIPQLSERERENLYRAFLDKASLEAVFEEIAASKNNAVPAALREYTTKSQRRS